LTVAGEIAGHPRVRSLLDGLLVLDLSRALAGPHAAMMLADMGARVIKVEPPGGDDSRRWGPPFVGEASADGHDERDSTYFLSCNRNKQSVVADLKTPEGLSLLRRLVARADVLCENFRPGVLARLGLDHEALLCLNPRLIVLSITGFGHDGPDGDRPGYDQIAQGEAGLMSLTGPRPDEPTRIGVPIADLLAGMYGAFGALAALHEREVTGRGRIVRTSLLAAVVGVHAFHGTAATVAGLTPAPSGNHHPSIAPYGLFRCAGGHAVQIAVGSEGLWSRFASLVGLSANDSRFANNAARVERGGELRSLIEDALAAAPAEHWVAVLRRAGIPAGVVRDLSQVYSWDQTRSQGLVISVDHPVAGTLTLPGSPLRFDDNNHSGADAHNEAPPILGQHTDAVSRWVDQQDTFSEGDR
jgi:crotonobetainyl-CoA:carnitine CoA-transferase CaiB-like acyl-CoA transferase